MSGAPGAPTNALGSTDETMRVVAVTAPGEPPAHITVPRPSPRPNEVLVRVLAASINPVDLAIASRRLGHGLEYDYPVVLGRDFAGVVVAAGAKAHRFSVGEEVFGFVPVAAPAIQSGSLGEFVAVAEDAGIAAKPGDLSFITAACLPLAGTAALMAVDFLNLHRGSVVLIVGATGGVGRFSVALAARRGATVVATGQQRDAADLLELGASAVAGYGEEVAAAVESAYPAGLDGLIYLVAPPGFDAHATLVRPGGAITTTVHCADVAALKQRGVAATNVLAAAEPAPIERLGYLAREGVLRPRVEHVFSFDRALDALAEMGRGVARGKTAIDLAGLADL